MKYKRLIDELIGGSIQMTEDTTRIQIDRPVFEQLEFDRLADYQSVPFSLKEVMGRLCVCSFRQLILTIIPVLRWVPIYKWQKNAMPDLMAGLTVGIITIPQAMAYAMLARAPPVVGLYMAIFPALMYFFFTTSRHNSMGTFSVISLMTGEIVDDIMEHENGLYHSMQIVATASFLVAIIQMCMYLLRLGLLAHLLSDSLTNGFLCGAGIHVVVSMLPSVLGLHRIKTRPIFSIPYVVYDCIHALPHANKAVLTMSFICIIVMVISNEIIKPWAFYKYGIILPLELFTIVIATAITYYFDLSDTYDIDILSHVHVGIPRPSLPVFVIIPRIITKCILIAIVSYSTTITMALMIATEAKYNVKPNQELLAMSMANFVGSFFCCIPISSSLSRTWVQYKTGGKTQLATIVSAVFVIMVLLFVNPLFNLLPKCVLSSIVVTALKGMLELARSMPRFFRLNVWDGLVWVAAFLPTVICNDTIGLFCGIVMSAVSIFVRANYPYTCVLGRYPGTEIYVDSGLHKGVETIKGIKIFHYCGALSFTMKLHFKHSIYEAAKLKPSRVLRAYVNPYRNTFDRRAIHRHSRLRILIIDFSALRYIDPSCVDLLYNIIQDYEEVNVITYIAGCHKKVFERIKICEHAQKKGYNFTMFPTVHDAVTYAEYKIYEMNNQQEQITMSSIDDTEDDNISEFN